MSNQTVLLTGGAGFIGSHVADYLLARGERVVVIDEVNDYYDVNIKYENLAYLAEKYNTGTEEKLVIYHGTLINEALVKKIFETENIDRVVHLAARAGVRPSIDIPLTYVRSNVEATTLLLNLSCEYKIKHFVFASSSSVYGGSKEEVFRETDIVDNPVSPYAATKKACELIAYTYHHLYNLNVAGLRFFTVYGPRGRPDMAPYKFIDRVMTGKTLQQYGDGTSERDYTYIDDIVQGVVAALDNPHGYQNYNLGRGFPTSLKKFISLVEENCEKKANIEYLPDQPGDVPRTCACIDKARELIGYDPKTSFEDGIKKTVAWYKEAVHEKQKRSGSEVTAPNSPDIKVLQKKFQRSNSITIHYYPDDNGLNEVDEKDMIPNFEAAENCTIEC